MASINQAPPFLSAKTPKQLMARAAAALDEARSRGGNCVVKSSRVAVPGGSAGGAA
ncbi:MAG: hypothetical protein HY204_08395 [Nitrospirae bacterium]|nr:hypothetical protein [Nitrospirota bacterium]